MSAADFDRWWRNEGSGMPPKPGEEACVFAERIAAIAWANGEFVARREMERKEQADDRP